MDALIMKNNKLPLKERYDSFIQKHPKFWLTLIYGVVMLALAITMFIVALNPPDNKSASADYQKPTECPNLDYYNYYYQENDITPELVAGILQGLPANNYRYVTCPTTFSITNTRDDGSTYLTYYAFRYIVCYHLYAGSFDLYSFYFSNTNLDPTTNGQPTDAVIIATSRFAPSHYDFSRASNFIINTDNFGAISYFPTLFEHYKYCRLSDLCDLGGSCSPDDLKAEYDKGHADGFSEGKLDGLAEGEQIGYDKGFLAGQNSVDPFPNPVSYLIEPVVSFLNIKFFDTLTLGGVLSVGLFVMVAVMFIKLFAGG